LPAVHGVFILGSSKDIIKAWWPP